MNSIVERAAAGMRKRGFEVVSFEKGAEAKQWLLENLPAGSSLGVGGSVSVRSLDVLAPLAEQGVIVHTTDGAPQEKVTEIRRQARIADAYICSANAVTKDGSLVLIDGRGNRVGAVCDGPEHLIFVISHSKFVDGGFQAAVARIKKDACPLNARRLGMKTRCAENGTCAGEECMNGFCRLTLVVDRPPNGHRVTVLLVEEPLGY